MTGPPLWVVCQVLAMVALLGFRQYRAAALVLALFCFNVGILVGRR